jgi:hypothetical protein
MEYLHYAMLALPLVFMVVFARRMQRVFEIARNPERLGQLLSQPLRASLQQAGLDPDRLDAAQLQKLDDHPALKRQVTDELQVAMRQVLSLKATAADSTPAPMSSPSSARLSSPAVSQSPEGWDRPLPIDHASRQRSPRWIVALLLAAAVASALISYL